MEPRQDPESKRQDSDDEVDTPKDAFKDCGRLTGMSPADLRV